MTDAGNRRRNQIRMALRDSPDGLTLKQIAELVPGWRTETLQTDLASMPDAYIDRWEPSNTRHKYVPVWSVVVPPPHCPKPE